MSSDDETKLKSSGENITTEQDEEPGPCSTPKNVAITIMKVILALGFLYIFFVSLGLLSDAFVVLGGAGLSELLVEFEEILNNPFCGLIIGILITVLCQSSSTSTSIFITMTGSGLLNVDQAIYMIMGANVGTSITSTLVAFGNSGQREEFARAMSSAVVLAAFNWLTVFILLPIEAISSSIATQGFLEWLTDVCTKGISDSSEGGESLDFFSVITNPLTHLFINVNKDQLGVPGFNGTFVQYCHKTVETCESSCLYPDCNYYDECYVYSAESGETCELGGETVETTFYNKYGEQCVESNWHMFMNACWSDIAVGSTVLVVALLLMFLSLAMIVKCLKSVLEGSISRAIAKNIDKDLPYVPFLTPYLYVLAGIVLTFSVQSSSIILAILTPLCGIGIISLERTYPVTVGCDIGTTATGLIAAFANPGDGFRASMRVSMSHLFFNLFGACFWFVVPIMRNIPISIARFAGRRTALYRWWAVNYIVGFFFVLPAIAFLLSIASEIALTVILITTFAVILFVVLINHLRGTACGQTHLPSCLKSWKWLPIYFRSLQPYDYCCSCKCCCDAKIDDESTVVMAEDYLGESAEIESTPSL